MVKPITQKAVTVFAHNRNKPVEGICFVHQAAVPEALPGPRARERALAPHQSE